jgi:hypothetical protein
MRRGLSGNLDKHRNPNAPRLDKGTSRFAQGSSARTTSVEVEKYIEEFTRTHGFRATIEGRVRPRGRRLSGLSFLQVS